MPPFLSSYFGRSTKNLSFALHPELLRQESSTYQEYASAFFPRVSGAAQKIYHLRCIPNYFVKKARHTKSMPPLSFLVFRAQHKKSIICAASRTTSSRKLDIPRVCLRFLSSCFGRSTKNLSTENLWGISLGNSRKELRRRSFLWTHLVHWKE